MKILALSQIRESLKGSYDEEADVLYISIDSPKPALGVDVGDGVIVRYDETRNEIVGVTIIGLRERTMREIADSQDGQDVETTGG